MWTILTTLCHLLSMLYHVITAWPLVSHSIILYVLHIIIYIYIDIYIYIYRIYYRISIYIYNRI